MPCQVLLRFLQQIIVSFNSIIQAYAVGEISVLENVYSVYEARIKMIVCLHEMYNLFIDFYIVLVYSHSCITHSKLHVLLQATTTNGNNSPKCAAVLFILNGTQFTITPQSTHTTLYHNTWLCFVVCFIERNGAFHFFPALAALSKLLDLP